MRSGIKSKEKKERHKNSAEYKYNGTGVNEENTGKNINKYMESMGVVRGHKYLLHILQTCQF